MALRKYLTVREAADYARVSYKSVLAWVYAGRLPATKRGKHRLIDEGVLVAWLEGGDEAGSRAAKGI